MGAPLTNVGPVPGLSGRKALVTGASKGLGRTVALGLARSGADVAVHYYRDRAGAEETVHGVKTHGRRALLLRADVAAWQEVSDLAEAIRSEWGGLDVVVNNAGEMPVFPWDRITPEDWERTIAVDLNGPFFVILATLPFLRSGGAIVNVSSVVAMNGGSFGPAYAAAKAGLIGLTRAAARDLGRHGIRVNTVAPGGIDSPVLGSIPAPAVAAMAKETPLGRLATFEEVADAILWLVSPGARFVTGQTLVVDGGRVMN